MPSKDYIKTLSDHLSVTGDWTQSGTWRVCTGCHARTRPDHKPAHCEPCPVAELERLEQELEFQLAYNAQRTMDEVLAQRAAKYPPSAAAIEAQRELVARAVAARGTPEDVDADALAELIVDGMSSEAAAKPEPLTWKAYDEDLRCDEHGATIYALAARTSGDPAPYVSLEIDVDSMADGKELAALLVHVTRQWRESRGER